MPTCLLFKAELLFIWEMARKSVGICHGQALGQSVSQAQVGPAVCGAMGQPDLSSVCSQYLPAECVSWEANNEVQLIDIVNMSLLWHCHLLTPMLVAVF